MKWDHMRKWIWLVLGVLVLTWVSVSVARNANVFNQLDVLVDVRHEIVEKYVEAPDEKKIVEAAVRGMVEALGDPHTIYLAPEEMEAFDDQVLGRFSGIGAEVTIDEQLNRLKIVTPLEDSPAWKAGVLAGDIVLEIDGKSTDGLNISEAVKRLKGVAGTQVTLKVRHETGQESVITVTREVINVKSVRGFRRDNGSNQLAFMVDPQRRIGYVKIRQFTDRTAEELKAALAQLEQEQVKALILDLRFDPGGLLPAAIEVSDLFLDGGKTIVSVRGRKVPEKIERSTSAGTFPDIPMVVLANEASASAAEIVTGALTDNKRAKFIGMRTFGKGSVQQVRMLDSKQGAIKITTAYYYLPSGRLIHRREDSQVWGVDPEDGFFVPMTTEQLRQMQRAQLDSNVMRGVDPAQITPEWITDKLADPQLAAGVRALIGKLETGEWPVVGQSGAQTVVKEAQRERLLRQREMVEEGLERIKQELAKLDEPEKSDAEQSAVETPKQEEKTELPVESEPELEPAPVAP